MAGQGIFCLEGEWGDSLTSRLSVRPGLDMLATMRADRLIHRNACTRSELEYYFTRWTSGRYRGFPLAYLSYHGSPGMLHLSADEELSLQELADLLPRSLDGRILYFGSCGTLHVGDDELQAFVEATGVRAVVGYTKDVDWAESAAFDFTLLPKLLDTLNAKRLYTDLRDRHPYYVKGLGLRVATSKWVSPHERLAA